MGITTSTPTKKDPFSFLIGPSRSNLLEIDPIPPLPWNSFLFPSFWYISKTEETLPPYLAGIPPLYNLRFLIASGLKTEKNPNKCEELNTLASSNRIKFYLRPMNIKS